MTDSRSAVRTAVGDGAVATLVFAIAIAFLLVLPLPVLQIPGYFLYLFYLPIERLVGDPGRLFYPLFGAYLVAWGLVAAGIAQVIRRRFVDDGSPPAWRLGTAGALLVLGIMSLYFTLGFALSGVTQTGPVLLIGATAVGLLGMAVWLVMTVDSHENP